jgi:chitodextrinase
MEADAIRRANNPNLGSLEDMEIWMRPLVEQYNANAATQRAVITIPIVFHIVHNNGADNISAAQVNAQIAQLNEDFRKLGAGNNSHPAGADAEITFCAATIDPSGNTMAEPGIRRVNRTTFGFTAPPYSQSYYESTIKPNTIWDPTQYCNVWVSNLSGGLLGYAQFPEAASLGGIGTGNGGANTDGVVILYSSVGSIANPYPGGGVYAAGRTLTHELGHWLGLRHIWGDGGCNVDDFCGDTPRAAAASSGCPTNNNTCNDMSYGLSTNPPDMVQNYMDYSYDACMNIFTNDQKARMQVVMSSSIRRASLASSNKCGSGGTTDTQAPTTPTNLAVSNIAQTTATLTWTASTDNVGVTGYQITLNGSVIGTVSGTSANLTGLTASTAYTATVVAKDAAGNSSNAATRSFTTLANTGGTCASSSLTLTLVFDNYPEETSWNIKNSSGTTVQSGGTYASQADGSTLNVNLTLASGNYTFTINDAYGDGMCCSYGNGSYALKSGGVTYASGGSFTSSQTTAFCVQGTADTQAPSTPTNVVASNIAQTTATVSWNASTDNVGVVSYQILLNGTSIGTTTGTSTALTGLTASTNYTVGIRAVDAAGNVSGTGSVSFTTLSAGGPSSQQIFAHYFETGWDGWADGGADCARYTGSRSYEGNYSIELRDNSGTASSMTLSNVNVSGYDQIELKFYFYANSMENGEDFWVRYNGGSGFQTVATYARGSFNNSTFYTATVVLNAANYTFPTNAQFRFQCDASADNDQIYIDQVTLTGITNARNNGSYFTIDEVAKEQELAGNEIKSPIDTKNEMLVYPNPATNELTIKTTTENNIISLYSISGILLNQFELAGTKTTIDVSYLDAGTYLIHSASKDGILVTKFIKN